MLKKLFFILLMLHGLAYAQMDFNHYPGLYSTGAVPDDFTTLSSKKYDSEKQNISYDDSRRDRKAQDQFFLESNFYEDKLLHSGRIVFGDQVTQYLNDIKDVILKDDPALSNQIRIYTYRSAEANAYTFNNGVVVFTTGLLAQAENEAQIAFIMCHEFNHYIEKHAINSYVESKKIARGEGIYRNLNQHDVELAQFSYSKDLETEADKKGVALFKKTNYNTAALQSAFDVLLYSYLPFDQVNFRTDYFNHENYRIPENYFLDTLKSISAEEDYDDEESTHPNIKKRKADALEVLGQVDNTGRQDFIVSEERFYDIQKICRYETVRLDLSDLRYEEAFYTDYLLLLEDPENPWLKKNMAEALYAISRYKTERSYSTSMHISYKKIEGDAQQFYYLADKLPAKDFTVLALQAAWPVYRNNMEDKNAAKMCRDLMQDLVTEHKVKTSDFKTAYIAIKADTVAPVTDTVAGQPVTETTDKSKTKNKYQKIKEEKTVTESKSGEDAYWRFAFVDLLKDEKFKEMLREAEDNKYTEKKEYEAGTYNEKKEEYSLGINKLVVVDPFYMKVDEKSDIPLKYVASEQSQIALRNKIKESAAILNIDVTFLENVDLDRDAAEKFNDLSVLNEWFSEKLSHADNGVELVNSNQEDFQRLTDKYATDNFMWLGIAALKEKEDNVGLRIFASCIYPLLLPFTIADVVTPEYSTYFFSIVADGQTGKFKMQYFNSTKMKDIESIQLSNIHYILYQIKSKKK